LRVHLSERGHPERGGGSPVKKIPKDPLNIIMAGVGGQGNVMAR
jgi:hypothetical protein